MHSSPGDQVDNSCKDSGRTRRIVLFALVVLLGGAAIPFRDSMTEMGFQLALLPLTAVLVYLVAAFFRTGLLPLPPPLARVLYRPRPETMALLIILVFLVLDFAMLSYESRLFAGFGYELGRGTAVLALAALLLSALALRFVFDGRFLAWSALLSLVAIQLISVLCFPLDPARSDMLPLVQIAGSRFLAGASPYSNVMAWDGVMTYLPGLWLTYVPSVFLGVDVRFTNLVCLAVAFIVILRTCRLLGVEKSAIPYLCAFFLNPWMAFRHDVYVPVVLMQFALVSCFLLQGRIRSSMAAFGWAVCSYPYSWVVFPLFLALLFRISGRRAVLSALLYAAGAFAVLVIPFLAWAPGIMIHSVLGVWRGVCQIESYNLSFWVLRILPLDAIKPFQALVLLGFYALVLGRIRNAKGFFALSAVAVLLFTMTSQLVWHYFFLLPPLFMLFHALAGDAAMEGGTLPPVRSGSGQGADR
jgi:hypothetical protein